jgi:hypothetical protein
MANEVQAKVQAAMGEYRAERARWIAESGSERLKLAVELGLIEKSDNVYLEERRDRERPGWRYVHEMPIGFKTLDIHNPSQAALEKLMQFRTMYGPSPTLVYLRWKQEFSGTSWKGPVVESKSRAAIQMRFLGRDIFFWVD